jgi:hypothetical protein
VGKLVLSSMARGLSALCKNLTIYTPTALHLQKVTGLLPNLLSQLTGNNFHQGEKNVPMSTTVACGLCTPCVQTFPRSGALDLRDKYQPACPSPLSQAAWGYHAGEGDPKHAGLQQGMTLGHDFVNLLDSFRGPQTLAQM